MKNQSYDLIGDIHGQHVKLVSLLHGLGYRARGDISGWSHAEGRKVIFLGDYIDRGPYVREVLMEVRAMVKAGDALAIMGNHEFSAILHETMGEAPANASGDLRGTLEQFAGFESEWVDFVAWMRGLPLSLDLGGIRAVHACWDDQAIDRIAERTLCDDDLLRDCLVRDSVERKAVDRLLNGPTIPVPDDALVLNSKGMPLPFFRVRWWNLPVSSCPIDDLIFPESFGGRGLIDSAALAGVPDYRADAPPVIFGHYWLAKDRSKSPITRNVACIDFSAAIGDAPLIAYRWDGEQVLSKERFFTTNPTHV